MIKQKVGLFMTDKETEIFNQLVEIIKFYQVDVRERKKQDYKKYITIIICISAIIIVLIYALLISPANIKIENISTSSSKSEIVQKK